MNTKILECNEWFKGHTLLNSAVFGLLRSGAHSGPTPNSAFFRMQEICHNLGVCYTYLKQFSKVIPRNGDGDGAD